MLELKNISLTIDENKILNNLNMRFDEGKRYVILGNNGTGKSTIANLMMGVKKYHPQEGKILLDGKDITDLGVYERAKLGITIAFQNSVRFEGITTFDYLTLGGKVKASLEDAKKALELAGLNSDYLKRRVDSSLSGGERKRIELASILMLEMKYVILDEPDSGIDMMSLETISNIINILNKRGTTTITITHREEIAQNSDYAYLICAGRVFNEGAPEKMANYYKELCDRCDHPNDLLKIAESR
ncbi:ATP-binding cassette domain-containing protein [Mesoaciditoga sp.]